MQKVPLFVELCAGTAALSLRLEKEGAKPPVSRMGAKTGYADRILTLLGLDPGQGADHYLWCEPDPGVRLLLEAYRDAELARAAAAIIRGWADEEPRALWERLRAEGPPRLPDEGAEAGEVARLCTIMRWAYANVPIGHNGKHYTIPANGPDAPLTFGANNFGNTETTANGLDRLPSIPATIAPDAREVDPREVARWAILRVRTMPQSQPGNPGDFLPMVAPSGTTRYQPDTPASGLSCMPTLPATIAPDARAVDPGPSLPPGTIAYMDPPYANTTGYANDLGREEVVALARRWAAAGAIVCISEAEPIPELVEEGWHAVEITDNRKGQKRTFSKQQKEWLTMNQPPTYGTGPVFDMFG